MFGRATIRLGIGPHSSYSLLSVIILSSSRLLRLKAHIVILSNHRNKAFCRNVSNPTAVTTIIYVASVILQAAETVNLLFGSRFQVVVSLRTKHVKQLQINHIAVGLTYVHKFNHQSHDINKRFLQCFDIVSWETERALGSQKTCVTNH